MRGTYAPALVVLSVLVATLASYSALRIADRISLAETPRTRRRWLAAGSLVMGYGVWAMHFIGMLAFRLPIPVTYDVPITALSVVPAIAASVIALHVVARKDPQRWLLITGGALMGAGIGAMHYTGMAAMRMNAEMRYDPLLFGVSIVVAVGLATVALYSHVVASARNASPLHWTQTGAAAVMGFAVAGMHYTGMAAVDFLASPDFLSKPLRAAEVFEKIARHLEVTYVDQVPRGGSHTLRTADMPIDLAGAVAQRLRAAIEVGDVSELAAVSAELTRESGPAVPYGEEIDKLTRAFDFEGLRRVALELDREVGE